MKTTDSKSEMKSRDEKRDVQSSTQKNFKEQKSKNAANNVSEANKKSPSLRNIFRSLHR